MKKKVIGLTILLLLFSFFVVINLFNNKENNKNNQETTTMSKKTHESNKDIIYIEGMEEVITTKKYTSHLGYNFKYEEELFDISLLSDGSLKVVQKGNENNFIKIEKLSESEYNKQYETFKNKKEIEKNNMITYKFLRGGNLLYLKVTKSVVNSSEYLEGINVRIDYIINSMSFN